MDPQGHSAAAHELKGGGAETQPRRWRSGVLVPKHGSEPGQDVEEGAELMEVLQAPSGLAACYRTLL